ncbi:MAG: adenosylmethionine decarboxylase [Candidatus Geothermarchaeales archaeon]
MIPTRYIPKRELRKSPGNEVGLGVHLILELYDCDPKVLLKASTVEQVLIEAARAADLQILRVESQQFEPHGATSMVVIGESHLAIHTWPEFRFAAADIFICGKNPFRAADALIEALKPKGVEILEVTRGSAISSPKGSSRTSG